MRVLVADAFERSGLEGLKAARCDVVHDAALEGETLIAALAETRADVLVVRSTKVTAAMMDRGALALIEGLPHSMSATAREATVLLEIGKSAFERLFRGDDRLAARFQEAINQELLQALARTNNHLTRLISQSRIRGGGREKKRVEELGQALGAQDCRN